MNLAESVASLDLTQSWVGFAAIAIFVVAYALVMGEERLHLRKSKPVIVAAGAIWALIGWQYQMAAKAATDDTTRSALRVFAREAVQHNLLEYAELLLFLLAAMTYINTMEERGVFSALRGWLINRDFSLRGVFWITGGLSFCISPVADNLTTALLMGAVVASVGVGNSKFVIVALINVVVAANAGGAFSPFGDITTLMVWQRGVVSFSGFFALFLPSLVNWLVPALCMTVAIGNAKPSPVAEPQHLRDGALVVIALFSLTIVMAVAFHSVLNLPPVLGMMTGLGFLKLFGFSLRRSERRKAASRVRQSTPSANSFDAASVGGSDGEPFDIFKRVAHIEWDTLMFFYGVVLCVGGLGTLGYLELLSHFAYGGFGPSMANIAIGLVSAVLDNIPVMLAVLSMHPAMDLGQWLLVTLTAGVGGSMLSIGSAAGVALMGQARGVYTFAAHLKWSWAIVLGYAASIWLHFLLNRALFDGVAVKY